VVLKKFRATKKSLPKRNYERNKEIPDNSGNDNANKLRLVRGKICGVSDAHLDYLDISGPMGV
jgi:hypothetical protein